MSLSNLLFAQYRQQVIGLLLLQPDRRYHVREVARMTGLAAPPVGRELNKLADLGVLTRERSGNQLLFQANTKCPIFNELAGIAKKTFGLGDVVMQAIEPYADQCQVVFVYGSMAAGNATTTSDIDLMILGKVSFEQIASSISAAEETLGREINPTILTPEEWHSKVKKRDAFVLSVLSKPKLFLLGTEESLDSVSKGVVE